MSKTGAIIEGVVREKRGGRVAGAQLYFIEAPVPMPDIAAMTNSAGEFALSVPSPGRYRIGCSSMAHAAQEIAVEVAAGEHKRVEVVLL